MTEDKSNADLKVFLKKGDVVMTLIDETDGILYVRQLRKLPLSRP